MTLTHQKKLTVQLGNLLRHEGWIAGCDGNISFLDSKNNIWITPTRTPKACVRPGQMVQITSNGKKLPALASSESSLHLVVYQNSASAKWVVHAHPPYTIAYTLANPDKKYLPWELMSELMLASGEVPIVPYQRPGTDDLAKALARHLPQCKILILARHGVVVWGESHQEAINGLERIEHAAKILCIAGSMGKCLPLPAEELSYLKARRKQIGNILL